MAVLDVVPICYISFVVVRPPDTRIWIHLGTVFVVGILPGVILVAYYHTSCDSGLFDEFGSRFWFLC